VTVAVGSRGALFRRAELDPASTFLPFYAAKQVAPRIESGVTGNGQMERNPAVYIVASGFHGTIHTGVTSNLIQRIHQHREGTFGGFTAHYRCRRLVWFEMQGDMEHAIRREKQIKNWLRAWKVALIEDGNSTWRDLAEDFGFESLIKKMDPASSPG
jgi:putative endonuclease